MIERFYHRLRHADYGVTELVVLGPGEGLIATGFFDDAAKFVKACQTYNGRYNLYAGRNPRPRTFPKHRLNHLDVWGKQRARDGDITHMTAMSLDIDPVRPKGTSSTQAQHRKAIALAREIQGELGGWVDSSGNGAYVWWQFVSPIVLTQENRTDVKHQCRQWQQELISRYRPLQYGLRIDGCYDLSRVKKVIGTRSVKGHIHRLSRCVVEGKPSDVVREQILNTRIRRRSFIAKGHTTPKMPKTFLNLLQSNVAVRDLWCQPEPDDCSLHDWRLGKVCLKNGVTNAESLAAILMQNPFGKYHRDRNHHYVKTTVRKLLEAT